MFVGETYRAKSGTIITSMMYDVMHIARYMPNLNSLTLRLYRGAFSETSSEFQRHVRQLTYKKPRFPVNVVLICDEAYASTCLHDLVASRFGDWVRHIRCTTLRWRSFQIPKFNTRRMRKTLPRLLTSDFEPSDWNVDDAFTDCFPQHYAMRWLRHLVLSVPGQLTDGLSLNKAFGHFATADVPHLRVVELRFTNERHYVEAIHLNVPPWIVTGKR